MVNIIDQAIQLAGKVLGHLLDWPFLLFILLVWFITRFRDQIGAFLDRRASLRRSDLSIAIREEIAPIAKDIGSLKADVVELKGRVAQIDGAQSGYREEKLISPLQNQMKLLDERLDRLQSELDSVSKRDLSTEFAAALSPLAQDVERVRRDLTTLETLTREPGPNAAQEAVQSEMGVIRQEVAALGTRLEELESRVENVPADEQAAGAREQAPANVLRSLENAVPLRIMKEALSSTRWEWRRVKKLAGMAGVTEEKALELLEGDPAFMVKKDDWGRRIAKLAEN